MALNLSTAEGRVGERLREVPWEALGALREGMAVALRELLGGRPAERALDQLLRRHRSLSAPERRAVAEAVFGVALWRRRLAWPLGLPWQAVEPLALLFVLLRDLAGLSPALAGQLAGVDPSRVPVREPPRTLADACSLPDWLAELFTRELGEQAWAFAWALNVPGPICIRANRLRIDRAALAERLAEEGVASAPTPYAPDGLVLHGRPNILGLRAHQAGLFEVQDEGSQLLAALVEARPGDAVLDFCAGAGGKALALAADLRGQGALHVHDPDPERLDRLLQRAARAGVGGGLHVHRDHCPPGLQVSRVLVDAPCSELGALRRGPDVRWRLDPATLDRFPPLQRDILASAARHVRPGGRLVYATCTLRREENEDVAAWFQETHPDFTPAPPGSAWLPADMVVGACAGAGSGPGFFRCLPHLHGTDAFFAAVLERRARQA